MRTLYWFAIPFSTAVFLAVYLLPEAYLPWCALLCGLCGLIGLLFREKTRKRILLVSFGAACGLLWVSFYGAVTRTPAHQLIQSSPATYTMKIKEFPEELTYGASVVAQLCTTDGKKYDVYLYAKRDALALQPEDLVQATVKLSPSNIRRGERNDYYQANGIYLIGNVSDEITLLERPSSISPKYLPQWVGRIFRNTILSVFPDDVSGFFTALLLGDKQFLPDGLYSAFQRAGIAHIVAVSGLHIGFLVALCAVFLHKNSRIAILFQIALLFFFAALTGNSPSALRAAFMTAMFLIAPLFLREDDRLTTLSLALLILLLRCPYAATSISLQLSFASLLGIILCSERLYANTFRLLSFPKGKLGRTSRRGWSAFVGSVSVSLGATAMTLPLTALYFRSVSLVAVLSNLLTLWAVSLAFTLGLLATLIGCIFPTIGCAAAELAVLPAKWVIAVAKTISAFPYSAVSLFSEYFVICFLAICLLLLLLTLKSDSIRLWIPCSALLLIICVTFGVHSHFLNSSPMIFTALDVGQGSSTLFYSAGHAVLVDCGGNKDNAGDIAANYIQAFGLSTLDALVLTHYDSDHINGVSELIERLNVLTVFVPDMQRDSENRAELIALCEKHGCHIELIYYEDANFDFGAASMKIFPPYGDTASSATGLSVRCSADDYDVLITGDMNSKNEHTLLKYKDLSNIECLIVGHHGSKHSTSAELLATAQPEIAIISSGYNTYGHPTAEVLSRLNDAECEIYQTALQGTLVFSVSSSAK